MTIDDDKASSVHAQISFGYRESWATFNVDYDNISFKIPPPPTSSPTLAPIDFGPLSGCVEGDGTFSLGTTAGFQNNFGSSAFNIIDDESDNSNKILSRTQRTISNGNDFKVVIDPTCLQSGSIYRHGGCTTSGKIKFALSELVEV